MPSTPHRQTACMLAGLHGAPVAGLHRRGNALAAPQCASARSARTLRAWHVPAHGESASVLRSRRPWTPQRPAAALSQSQAAPWQPTLPSTLFSRHSPTLMQADKSVTTGGAALARKLPPKEAPTTPEQPPHSFAAVSADTEQVRNTSLSVPQVLAVFPAQQHLCCPAWVAPLAPALAWLPSWTTLQQPLLRLWLSCWTELPVRQSLQWHPRAVAAGGSPGLCHCHAAGAPDTVASEFGLGAAAGPLACAAIPLHSMLCLSTPAMAPLCAPFTGSRSLLSLSNP